MPSAYLSEAPGTANRCVVAFKVTLTNAEMLFLFYDIVDRVSDGATVGVAAEAAWNASGLYDKYNDLTYENAMRLVGDPKARPRWLYDQTHNSHTDWRRST